MAPPPLRSPAALMDELVEEILLRIPPDDPARLARAALVCKRWWRLASDPRFRRRFREFYRRTPPMLGFLSSIAYKPPFEFIPTSSFRPPAAAVGLGRPIDARHGRVLLDTLPFNPSGDKSFVLWDPVTGERRSLPLLPLRLPHPLSWNAAVLCAAAPCDHLDCQGGPFLVVFVCIHVDHDMVAYVYSSEDGAWGEPTYAPPPRYDLRSLPSVLVGNSLYFVLCYSSGFVKFDLGTRRLSVIPLPSSYCFGRLVLTTTDDGELGFATIVNSRLCLWSRKSGLDTDTEWAESSVIDLNTLVPDDSPSKELVVAGFADGAGVIFVYADQQLFTIDLKYSRVRKTDVVCNSIWSSEIFPYVSFCTPAALGAVSTSEGPGAGASSA